MYSITIQSNTVTLPEEIAKTLIGKTVTPIVTNEGVLLKSTETDTVASLIGILHNENLTVDKFIERKQEEKKLER